MSKWWKDMCFWMKLKAIITSIGIGSEVALFLAESHHNYKIGAAVATVVGILITHIIEDKDNNGIVDLFQKKKETRKDE